MLYHSNFFKLDHGNFGDDLNGWMWPRLIPEACAQNDSTLFLGIGSILTRSVPPERTKVVFGSGCSGSPAPEIDSRWHIYAVRGPQTVRKLQLPPGLPIGDPAILVRRLWQSSFEKNIPIAFMPHHQSIFEADWNKLCQEAGLHCINPHHDVATTLESIARAKLLLTEALHGAIVADTLRVPWIPVRVYRNFLEFKWKDWTESLGLALEIQEAPPIYDIQPWSGRALRHGFKRALATSGLGKDKWRTLRSTSSSRAEREETVGKLQHIAKTITPCLSSETRLAELESSLWHTLERLRRDWQNGKFKG